MSDNKTDNHPASSCGKTYPVCYPPRTTHSDTFWLDWFRHVSHYNRQGENGQTLVMCIQPELSLGESSMLNTSVSPNAAKECSLWQVLDQEASPKYSLSKKACEGILHRAEKRGKVLPDLLRQVLLNIANPSKPKPLEPQGRVSGGSETPVVLKVLFDIAHRSDVVRIQSNITPTLTARMGTGGNNIPCIAKSPFTVRKLTVRECERLQGFPDDWTKIPYRSKSADECPDSPRYKAIGNSMAVPCMRWIGQRLNDYLAQSLV